MNREELIIEKLRDKKAEEICVVNITRDILIDKFIIANATSSYHLKTLSEYLKQELKEYIYGIDGNPDSEWIVVDVGDILIHLFTDRMRRIYNLEELGETIKKEGNNGK